MDLSFRHGRWIYLLLVTCASGHALGQTFQTPISIAFTHFDETATLLSNGIVVVAGDFVELYLPVSGVFVQDHDMIQPRFAHTAVQLFTGRVLFTGGNDTRGADLNTNEIYTPPGNIINPAIQRFQATGTLTIPRRRHTATLLNDGRVLIAGGLTTQPGGGEGVTTSVELYDPATGTCSPTGNMATPRYYHAATLLTNGSVLITGGQNFSQTLSSAELYDPALGSFRTVPMVSSHTQHTATLLRDGRVVIIGGPNIELYDPASGIFMNVGQAEQSRYRHTATLINNGTVLVAGGSTDLVDFSTAVPVNTTEIFDPSLVGTGFPSRTAASMSVPRSEAEASLLQNGNVIIIGGITMPPFGAPFPFAKTAEVFKVPPVPVPPRRRTVHH